VFAGRCLWWCVERWRRWPVCGSLSFHGDVLFNSVLYVFIPTVVSGYWFARWRMPHTCCCISGVCADDMWLHWSSTSAVHVNLHWLLVCFTPVVHSVHCSSHVAHDLQEKRTDMCVVDLVICKLSCRADLGRVSHFIFLWESRFYGSGVLAKVWDAAIREFCASHNLSALDGIDVTILWAWLAKRSKEISCSRNLVAARDFYDARRTFYVSSYENRTGKKCETCVWSAVASRTHEAACGWKSLCTTGVRGFALRLCGCG